LFCVGAIARYMPRVQLRTAEVERVLCPPKMGKVNLFDLGCKGLMLEVRTGGGKTWYLRYTDARGKQRQHRMGDALFIPLKVARRLARELQGRIALGEDPQAKAKTVRATPTFAEFVADKYLPYIQGYKRSWKSDDSYLRTQLLPVLGKLHLDEITKQKVADFHNGMRAKGYALGTCNRCLVLLRYALNLAIRWEIDGISTNPTLGCKLFDDPPTKERFLSQTEAHALHQAVRYSQNQMLQYIVPMLILTGARKREVLDAKWEDFDLERRQWRIPVTKLGRPRHVPISDAVLELLALVPKKPGLDYVFANPRTGKPFVSIFCAWDTARTSAGLEEVRIHDLRHSFASFLVNAGRSLYEVQKLLGHTQIKTTQRYAHLSQQTLLDAANAANLSMGAPRNTTPDLWESHTN